MRKSLFAGGWVLKILDCMSRARSVERYMGASGHESSHCVTPTQLTRHSDCLLAEQKGLHDCNSVRLSSNPAMKPHPHLQRAAQWCHGIVAFVVFYKISLFLRGWFRRRRCRRFRRWCLGGIGRLSWRLALTTDKIEKMVFCLLALSRS